MIAVHPRRLLTLLALVVVLMTAVWWFARPASEAASPSVRTSASAPSTDAGTLTLALGRPLTLPIGSFQVGLGRGVSGTETSQPSVSEATISLETGATDPLLLEAAVSDDLIPTATVKLKDVNGTSREWLLTDVIISGASWSHGGSRAGGGSESLSLNFGTATLTTFDRSGHVVESYCVAARREASC